MRTPTLLNRLLLLPVALPLLAAAAWAQDPDPLPPGADRDESTPSFVRAVLLQREGRWTEARDGFRSLLQNFPDSVHAEAADARSGDNAYLGTRELLASGPSARRIDVAVMGDGFLLEERDQELQTAWADLAIEVLFRDKALDAYRDYFNVWFVRLASAESGVDPVGREKERIEERNRKRTNDKPTDYSTALDCKASGPSGQVSADRRLVYHWLGVADEDAPGAGDDALVIAFARFGRLGTGGWGIANMGKPTTSITVHEFGHAFAGLGDEYVIRKGRAKFKGGLNVPNLSTSPKRADVPWKHFLDARVKGVKTREGGAGVTNGVWRPANNCAMNASRSAQYCPVCREATILRIYAYVDPVDAATPDPEEDLEVQAGSGAVLAVLPMQPREHDLEVTWWVAPAAAAHELPMTGAGGPEELPDEDRDILREMAGVDPDDDFGGSVRFTGGERGRGRAGYVGPPPGRSSQLGSAPKAKSAGRRHRFPVADLSPGEYIITARVRDRTEWVLRDVKSLLESRVTWTVRVLR